MSTRVAKRASTSQNAYKTNQRYKPRGDRCGADRLHPEKWEP